MRGRRGRPWRSGRFPSLRMLPGSMPGLFLRALHEPQHTHRTPHALQFITRSRRMRFGWDAGFESGIYIDFPRNVLLSRKHERDAFVIGVEKNQEGVVVDRLPLAVADIHRIA